MLQLHLSIVFIAKIEYNNTGFKMYYKYIIFVTKMLG